MHPTLLVLAAGMGSRYGSLKQLDPMGPAGQTMLDYAVHDAIHAGFGKVVFVIRKDFEAEFRSGIGQRYEEWIELAYAFQDLNDLPEGFLLPGERIKPWGTAHAIRAARDVVAEPFAVINADDFYGREAYCRMAQQLSEAVTAPHALQLSMVGYRLKNTLSPHGAVNRGICVVEDGKLQSVEELTTICRDTDGVLRGTRAQGERVEVSPHAIVSMNLWGFTPALFERLEQGFAEFLQQNIHLPKSEYYIPTVVDELIRQGVTDCTVLKTESPWFGVTYPEDRPRVVASLKQLSDDGVYD